LVSQEIGNINVKAESESPAVTRWMRKGAEMVVGRDESKGGT